MSTHQQPAPAPEMLFSVITDYGSGRVIAEHFPTRWARRMSLLARADQFFEVPDAVPERVRADEARLAGLISAFLMPAAVLLTESALDTRSGTYLPAEHARAATIH